MDEKSLQALSKALTHIIFRNGVVEDLHAGEGARLTDDIMKILNKDVNNRIYTLLSLWFGGEEEQDILFKMLDMNMLYGKNWDQASIPEDMQRAISYIKEEIE